MPWTRSVNSGSNPKSSLRRTSSSLGFTTRRAPTLDRLCQHADGLDMPHDLQAAATEYLGWLQLEANRSPNTVRAYESELRKLIAFLVTNGHSLAMEGLRHDDLRAYQRHLARRLKNPASRARALVAIRS